MHQEFVFIKGFLLTWLLLVSALSDPSVEPFNSNFNRFRQKIPRIGRRGEGIISEYMDSDSFPHEGSLSNFFLKASKAVPRLGRRNKDISDEERHARGLGEAHLLKLANQDIWPKSEKSQPNGGGNEVELQDSRLSKEFQENLLRELILDMWSSQNENKNQN